MPGVSRSMRRSRATNRLTVSIAAAVAIGMVGLLVRDRVRAQQLEREVAARLRLGPNGIVMGAEPETLIGSRTHAVLVVHGFGDTPQSVRELAHSLHARGFTVEVPLLPGHGRTLTEFGDCAGVRLYHCGIDFGNALTIDVDRVEGERAACRIRARLAGKKRVRRKNLHQ